MWSTFELLILWLNQMPLVNPKSSLQSAQVGDTLLSSTLNPTFVHSFGLYMCYNPNLVLSLLGTMQQPYGTPQRPLQLTPSPMEQPTPSQPTPQAPKNIGSQGQQSASLWIDVSNTNKILLKPEGTT